MHQIQTQKDKRKKNWNILSFLNSIISCFSLFLFSAALSGCGKKGPLEIPEGSTYPQPYPKVTKVEIGN